MKKKKSNITIIETGLVEKSSGRKIESPLDIKVPIISLIQRSILQYLLIFMFFIILLVINLIMIVSNDLLLFFISIILIVCAIKTGLIPVRICKLKSLFLAIVFYSIIGIIITIRVAINHTGYNF